MENIVEMPGKSVFILFIVNFLVLLGQSSGQTVALPARETGTSPALPTASRPATKRSSALGPFETTQRATSTEMAANSVPPKPPDSAGGQGNEQSADQSANQTVLSLGMAFSTFLGVTAVGISLWRIWVTTFYPNSYGTTVIDRTLQTMVPKDVWMC